MLLAWTIQVFTFGNFHNGVGDNDSLRKNIIKRSIQGQHLNRLDTPCPFQCPKRRWIIANLELEEEDEGPFPKTIGVLFNKKSHDRTIKYVLSGPGVNEYPEPGLFSLVDDSRGVIQVHRSVDRETITSSFEVHLDVKNASTGEIVDRALRFTVKIKDKNDNAPKFPENEFNITVKENHRRDESVFQVTAFDADEGDTANSRVEYSLVSQIPSPKQPVFTVESSTGRIHISGCSHYEDASTFKLLIKAADHGTPPLFSTAAVNIAIEDSNNHLPVFASDNYELDITEGKTEGNILRLNVEDEDTRGTPAWRAKYKIVRGNEGGNFIIKTDPNSNDGVLSIVKPLVYDGIPGRSLVISVENEEPFSSCDRGQMRSLHAPRKTVVNITVLDTNDAPQFHPPVLVLRREEGLEPGTQLGQYTAMDPDRVPNAIRYEVAFDPANWVAVDKHSGILTTMEILDRESPYVNSSTYTVLIHATDDGVPPQTGTGTVQIFLFDVNDNAPKLVMPFLEVCEGTEKVTFQIEAEDKDDFPHAGPFTFHLVEGSQSMKDVWKLGRDFGDSAELLMLKNLPFGNYSVPFRILDKQAFFRDQNLSVRVCPCLDGGTCVLQPAVDCSGLVVTISSAILLLVLGSGLLLWFYRPWNTASKKNFSPVPFEKENQTVIYYSEESKALPEDMPDVRDAVSLPTGYPNFPRNKPPDFKKNNNMTGSTPRDHSVDILREMLDQRLRYIASLEDDRTDSYPPHVYAEEGSMGGNESLWSLRLTEDSGLPPDFVDTLGPPFANLNKICSK